MRGMWAVGAVGMANLLLSLWLSPRMSSEPEERWRNLRVPRGSVKVYVQSSSAPSGTIEFRQLHIRRNDRRNILVEVEISIMNGMVEGAPRTDGRSQSDLLQQFQLLSKGADEDGKEVLVYRSLSNLTRATKARDQVLHVMNMSDPYRYKIDYEVFYLDAESAFNNKRIMASGVITSGDYEYRRMFASPSTVHSAAHGLTFELEAKSSPVMVSLLRTRGLASFQRGPLTPPLHIRVYLSTEDKDVAARKWRLIGEMFDTPLSSSWDLSDLPIEPFYIASGQRVSLSIHTDHPLGLSVAVPSFEGMASEIEARTHGSLLVPQWLSMMTESRPAGVHEDEWVRVLPGAVLDFEPLLEARPQQLRCFIGMIQYSILGEEGDYRQGGMAKLFREHVVWFNSHTQVLAAPETKRRHAREEERKRESKSAQAFCFQ